MLKVTVVLLFQITSVFLFLWSMFSLEATDHSQGLLYGLGILTMTPGVGAAGCVEQLKGIVYDVMDFLFLVLCSISVCLLVVAGALAVAGDSKSVQSREQTYEISLSSHKWNE